MPRDTTDTRWRRIDELFAAALERQGAERDAFIAQAAEGNEALRDEIESLLRAHDESSDFLKSAMFDEAVGLIAKDEEPARDASAAA